MDKIKNNHLRLSQSTAIENDLSYFVSVLAEINNVVSKTYGPEAAYVAQHDKVGETNAFTYTKDGLMTLYNLRFGTNVENYVLSMMHMLVSKIKETSGDGSTTAAKLLYYMVKTAYEDMIFSEIKKDEENQKAIARHRRNTPKAMTRLITYIKEEINKRAKTTATYDDLRKAAFISLNSDETLMGPINDLIDHMEANKSPIDESLRIEAFRSLTEDTKVDYNPGYLTGAQKFLITSQLQELEAVKIVMIPQYFSADMAHFILGDIIRIAYDYSKNLRLVFLVNGMDSQTKDYLRKIITEKKNRLIEEKQDIDKIFSVDIIEMNRNSLSNDSRFEDISMLLNTQPINLMDYIEKRDQVISSSVVDRHDTTNLFKWKATVTKTDDGQEMVNEMYGQSQFMKEYYEVLNNSFYANIKQIPNMGLSISLSQLAIDHQLTPTYHVLFNQHIDALREAEKSQDKAISEDASRRLFFLLRNFYTIHVGKRIGDNERIYTAYKDAVKALTSIAHYGYHMGGSMSLYTALFSVFNKSERGELELTETEKYLLDILINAVEAVILDLKLDFADKTVYDLVKEGRINTKTYEIDDTKVIIPVETDLVMVPNTLYLFANIYASLMVEFMDPNDTLAAKQLAMRVKSVISEHYKEEKETKEESTPESSSDEIVEDNTEEELVEETEVENEPIEEEVIVESYEEPEIDEKEEVAYEEELEESELSAEPTVDEEIFEDEEIEEEPIYEESVDAIEPEAYDEEFVLDLDEEDFTILPSTDEPTVHVEPENESNKSLADLQAELTRMMQNDPLAGLSEEERVRLEIMQRDAEIMGLGDNVVINEEYIGEHSEHTDYE